MPLEERIRALIGAGVRGVVHLLGPAGSGKTTALRHLAAVLPSDAPVRPVDESDRFEGGPAASECLVVRAASAPRDEPHAVDYRLAPWGDDDLIEYLLAVHHEHCAAVMGRLEAADRELLEGLPELWRIVLEQMVEARPMIGARDALRRCLHEQLRDPQIVERTRYECLGVLIRGGPDESSPAGCVGKGLGGEAARIVRHKPIQLLLAAERMAADLRGQADCDYLARRLPRSLIQAAAAEVAGDEAALQRLRDLLGKPSRSHAMTASLLHAAASGWVPGPGAIRVLAGAYLDHAAWAGVQLQRLDLCEADLSHADLTSANLDAAEVSRADLRQACLAHASLNGFRAVEADLSGVNLGSVHGEKTRWDAANLENADLRAAMLPDGSFRRTNLIAATFAGAYLGRATFAEVELQDADFSGADLHGARLSGLRLRQGVFSGACFAEANLNGSDMEGMELPGVDFHGASLKGVLLTDAALSGANFEGACLREAGLGHVNLERACLRNADLRGATFHMGSSRSGLVFTPIASEGTRTGFYTDEADEQNFKAPEEIRKANLRWADLRGASIDGVDFYLVDLRGALYDPDQEEHFRRCRAILEDRTEGTA